MRTIHIWLSLAVAGALLTPLSAQRLYWLGTTGGNSYATGVSNDGSIVVGESNGQAVIWDRAANTIITVYNGASFLSACSASGTIAVGFTNPGYYSYQTPFMWTRQAGFQWLPPHPDFGWCADITPSGAIVAGKARSPSGDNLAAVWDLTQNPPVYRTYGFGTSGGEAYGVSDDGRTLAAFLSNYRGVVFRLKPDFTVDWHFFLQPVSGHYGCVPREISEDGGVVVGNSGNIWGGSYYPAMWRASNNWAPELLANLGGSAGEAWDIRGGIIIGFSTTPSGERRAVRWQLGTATTQVEDLNQTYAALLTGGSVLRSANAFSPNGRFIVGWGRNAATGRDEAFLLDTQRCASENGDVDANGCVDDADLLAVLFNFGNTGNALGREDTNCDGIVDDADLLTVLFNFGSGC
jgi:uncharacterized membrane protein